MGIKTCLVYARNLICYPRITVAAVYHRVRIRLFHRFTGRPTILFKCGGAIGDIICSFPAVLALRLRYPRALIIYAVRREWLQLVKMGKVADYVVESDWSAIAPKVCLHDYTMYFHPLLADQGPPGRKHPHLVDDYCETLKLIPKSRQPVLYVPDDLLKSAKDETIEFRSSGHLVIGIHVGPTWTVRQWPAENWEKLVSLLHERFLCTIVQLGVDFDSAKGKVLVPRIKGTLDWVGKFNLGETIALVKTLDILIGIDSSLLHVAGAVGTPSIGLFGPVDPALRLPPETLSAAVTAQVPCLGCHHRTPVLHWRDDCPFSIACMKQLRPEAVGDAVCLMMEELQSSGKLSAMVQQK